METIQSYFSYLNSKLNDLQNNEANHIEAAAHLIVESFQKGGDFYIFGTGHSHMIAEEMYLRAGGLAFVKAILPPEMMLHEMVNKSTYLERLPAYAEALLKLYPLNEKDVIVIISNSGRNSVPVEMALEAKKRGAKVIAITSLKHTSKVTSRQKDGYKLNEVADLVIDNQAAYGDAEFMIQNSEIPVAGVSDFIGIAIVQTLTATVASKIAELGLEVPVFLSGNLDHSEEWNEKMHRKYVIGEK